MRPGQTNGSNDAAIIALSLADPDAFSPIFEQHHDAIYRYLATRSGPEVATEVTSETFLTAFEQRARFDSGYSSAKPWLFGIANNLLKAHLRHRSAAKRTVRPIRDDIEPFDEDVAWRADAEALVRESGLVEAINSLPWRDREILFLFAFADLSYSEIAEACGVPIGTVRSRLSRMRARLFSATAVAEHEEPV